MGRIPLEKLPLMHSRNLRLQRENYNIKKLSFFQIFGILFLLLIPQMELQARLPQRVEGDGERDYWEFLFLYEKTSAPGQIEKIIRPVLPVYGSYENKEYAYRVNNVLYPVFMSHGTNYWSRRSILNLFTTEKFYHKDKKLEEDSINPLVQKGKGDSEDERYLSIFPIYGRLKDKMGYDEIHYVMFPFYSSWSYGDYRAKSILWPFVMWGKGKKRNDFRILPFYSKKEYEGRFVRKSILWPFVQWGHLDIDKKSPRSYFHAWPFYGRKKSDDGSMSAHTVAWPLFSWGWDDKREAFNVKLFLGLYQYGRSKDPYIKKHFLLIPYPTPWFFLQFIPVPIFMHYRFGSKDGKYYRDTKFFFLYGKQITKSAVLESENYFLIPFFWYHNKRYNQEEEWDRYVKIWPLFNYSNDSLGNIHFRTLDLWPWKSDKVDRYWGPIWTLYQYDRFENGDVYHSLLLRSFSTYKSEHRRRVFVLGNDFMKSEKEFSFQILGGLFGYHRRNLEPGEKDLSGRLTEEEMTERKKRKSLKTWKVFWFSFGKQ